MESAAGAAPAVDRVAVVQRELDRSIVYWAMKRAIKDEVLKPKYRVEDLRVAIPKILNDLRLTPKLRNLIYDIARKKNFCGEDAALRGTGSELASRSGASTDSSWALQPIPGKTTEDGMLDAIRDARQEWDKCIAQRMNSASRHGVPWVRVRLDRESLPKALTPCYEDSDLLDAVTALCSHNHKGDVATDDAHFFLRWERVRVQLRRPLRHSLGSMRRKFAMLSPAQRHVGLDDDYKPWYAEHRDELGARLTASGSSGSDGAERSTPGAVSYALELRQYARCGVPTELRARVWEQILRVDGSSHHAQDAFADLQRQCDGWELLVDKFVEECLRDTLDDENYFVFEDKMREILMALTRDTKLAEDCSTLPHAPLSVLIKEPHVHDLRHRPSIHFPPCGIVPTRGWARWLAPLCFLSTNTTRVFTIYRALFTRYFCRLHTIDDKPGSILSLCQLFEQLVHAMIPETCFHMLQLGCPPLHFAFHWMVNMFVEYLPVKEVLLLWDRVLGFDSLELLPLLAAAIFVFRKADLCAAQSMDEVEMLLEEFNGIKVVPLLQQVLFVTPLVGT